MSGRLSVVALAMCVYVNLASLAISQESSNSPASYGDRTQVAGTIHGRIDSLKRELASPSLPGPRVEKINRDISQLERDLQYLERPTHAPVTGLIALDPALVRLCSSNESNAGAFRIEKIRRAIHENVSDRVIVEMGPQTQQVNGQVMICVTGRSDFYVMVSYFVSQLNESSKHLSLAGLMTERGQVQQRDSHVNDRESQGPPRVQEGLINVENTPDAVFTEYSNAFETGNWENASRRLSPSMMKHLLYECLHGTFIMSGPRQDQMIAILAEYEVDFEDAARQAERLADQDYLDVMLSSSTDAEALLAKACSFAIPAYSRFEERAKELVLDGERAVVLLDKFGGNGMESKVFLRMYNGRWKVCVEQEWRDAVERE